MRELLFRGKTKKNGNWVRGNLGITSEGNPVIYKYYSDADAILMGDHMIFVFPDDTIRWDVYPDSVGQYTGREDTYRNRIFENDIILSENLCWRVCWSDEESAFIIVNADDDTKLLKQVRVPVVVGNIFDDPELMGKKE